MENEQLKRLKFLSKEKSGFYQTLRQKVDTYFLDKNIEPTANSAMVLKTITLLGLYSLPYLLLVSFHLPALAVIFIYAIMGFAMAGIGMSIMHDANHSAYSKNKSVNQWLGYTLNIVGMTAFNWKLQHNILHHTYTNVYEYDEDIDGPPMLRLSPHHPYKKMHKYQHIYVFFFYSLLTLNWLFSKDFIQLVKYRKNGLNRSSKREYNYHIFVLIASKVIYLFYMLFIPIYFLHYGTTLVIISFLVLHCISGLILSITFQLAHSVTPASFPLPNNKYTIENDWAIHQINTTVDFSRKSKFLNWYLGGLNFQVEHHLFPHICHIHYVELSKIVEETAKEFNIKYLSTPTLIEAIKTHLNALRQFGSMETVSMNY